jgi:hypothetical protein
VIPCFIWQRNSFFTQTTHGIQKEALYSNHGLTLVKASKNYLKDRVIFVVLVVHERIMLLGIGQCLTHRLSRQQTENDGDCMDVSRFPTCSSRKFHGIESSLAFREETHRGEENPVLTMNLAYSGRSRDVCTRQSIGSQKDAIRVHDGDNSCRSYLSNERETQADPTYVRVDDDAFTAFGSHGQRIAGEFSVDQLSAIRETIRYGKWKNAKASETLHAESWYNSHSVSISLGNRQREHNEDRVDLIEAFNPSGNFMRPSLYGVSACDRQRKYWTIRKTYF